MADIRCGGIRSTSFETYDRLLCNEIRWLAWNLSRQEFLATVLDPVLKLLSNITQKIPSNPLALAIGIKEADYPLGLLKRLN